MMPTYTTGPMAGARRSTPVPAAARRAQVENLVPTRKGDMIRKDVRVRWELARMMKETRS